VWGFDAALLLNKDLDFDACDHACRCAGPPAAETPCTPHHPASPRRPNRSALVFRCSTADAILLCSSCCSAARRGRAERALAAQLHLGRELRRPVLQHLSTDAVPRQEIDIGGAGGSPEPPWASS
jgi:hypothetical protein